MEPPKTPREAWSTTTVATGNNKTQHFQGSSDSRLRTSHENKREEASGPEASPVQTSFRNQCPGSNSMCHVGQPAPIAQDAVFGSEFGNLSKVFGLFKDPSLLYKLSNEQIVKTVSTVDCTSIQSEILKVATMQQQFEEQRKELELKSNEITKLEAKVADLETQQRLTDDKRKVKQGKQQKTDVHKSKEQEDDYRKKIEALMEENKKLSEDISKIQGNLHQIVEEKRQISDELTETKNRLSRLMGDKLTDGNAEIADLSDENRPTKIAEKYSELYDNKWTDAYELLQTHDFDEKSIIAILLEILQSTKHHCDEMSASLTKRLMTAVTMTDTTQEACTIPDNVNKQMKYLKRLSAGVSMAKVFDVFMESTKTWQPTQDSMSPLLKAINESPMISYIQECVSVCWLMCVQDPPLAMEWHMKHNDPFNSNVLKVYTKSGPAFDFLVWPPLYLKANGPLLSRGVAQGMPVSSKDSGSKALQRQKTAPPAGLLTQTAAYHQRTSFPTRNESKQNVTKGGEFN